MVLLNIDLREGLREEFFSGRLLCRRGYGGGYGRGAWLEKLGEPLRGKWLCRLSSEVVLTLPHPFVVEHLGEVFA